MTVINFAGNAGILPCFRSRWQDAHVAKRSLLELLTVFNLYLSLLLQEEEIPELEIDIDELLELEDEGQRTRLQVMLCRTTLTPHHRSGLSIFNC